MLSAIRIVLVETSHPGNIGATARAMKNMSLNQLYLVKPHIFPCADATARASGADDILASAVVCESLNEAIADCSLVIGASARSRTITCPELNPRDCAEKVIAESQHQQIAIIFGRENSGLKNHELDLCQYLLSIPCNPDYSSLNLAAAVQVVCYELLMASRQNQAIETIPPKIPPATAQQMALFYEHLLQTLHDIEFIQSNKSDVIMRRLRRLYHRSQLDSKEVDMLRGILRMSQKNNR